MAAVCLLGAALLATPILLVGWFVPNAVTLDDESFPGSPVAPLEDGPSDGFRPDYARDPAARAVLDGKWRLTHLARSKQGTVVRTHQIAPAQDEMAGWTDLGGSAAGNPVTVPDSDKRMAAFVIGADGSLSYNPQVEADASAPGTWQDLGGAQLIGTPAAAQDATGRLHVFARSTAGGLWETHQSRADEGGWTGLREIPGPPIQDDPVVHVDSQHTLKLFALGGDGVVRTHAQAALGADEWNPAQQVPGIAATSPSVILDEFGKLHLFAQGPDGEIVQSSERDTATNVWSGWRTWRQWRSEPGAFAGRPMVATGATGILVLFARDANGAVHESWQSESQRFRWYPWQPHEGDLAELTAAVKDSAGKMVVYGIGRDGSLTRTRQDSPSSGPWHEWSTDLGGELDVTTTS
ncbi:hypothetical protein [Saccharopolyspora gloriosae]|uniref:PLL-like beta propeller domain-containing protein n=1 Tax=Saccharopolyspora gloriosae TaxID=455344 RepID=A0A840NCS5_9PSEU|nr:hypothetical protein [Saccharopolyspora gloriosae]MBB5068018.1 hypothetical protein [Saccharopolyspora gloriosae]